MNNENGFMAENWIKAFAFISAVLFLGIFLFTALSRMAYPFELEWIEGGMLLHLQYIMEGNVLYLPPNIHFGSFMYTPLYYYISYLVSTITGIEFLTMRLVSIVSTIGIGGLLFFSMRKQTRSLLIAAVTAGLFFSLYPIRGYWYDIARNDMLMLFLLFSGFLLLRSNKNIGTLLISLLLFNAAIFTKQSAIIPVIALIIIHTLFTRVRRIYIPVVFILFFLTFTIIFELLSDGNFIRTITTTPTMSNVFFYYLPTFFIKDLMKVFPVAIPIIMIFFIGTFKSEKNREYWFDLTFLITSLFISFLLRIKIGGYFNTLIPADLAIVYIFGKSCIFLFQKMERIKLFGDNKTDKFPVGRSISMLLILLLSFQLYANIYDFREQIPDEKQKQSAQELVDLIASFPGPVYVRKHTYFSHLAGKETFIHFAVLQRINWSGETASENESIQKKLKLKMEEGYFDAIITCGKDTFLDNISLYRYCGKVFGDDNELFLATGAQFEPLEIYIRNDLVERGIDHIIDKLPITVE